MISDRKVNHSQQLTFFLSRSHQFKVLAKPLKTDESHLKFSGVVTLQTDFQICKEGDTLTPEQARLLVRS